MITLSKEDEKRICFHASYTFPRHTKYNDAYVREVENLVRQNFAHHVMTEKMLTIVNEDYVEKRLSLIVATHGEFWELVRREAERLAERLPPL